MELSAQPAAFVAFAVFRSSFYSVTTAFVTVTFGFQNFGKLWGLTIFTSAFFSLLQYLFLFVVYEHFDGRFNFFNHFMTALNIASFAFPLWLWFRSKVMARQEQERTRGSAAGGDKAVAQLAVATPSSPSAVM